MPASVHGAYSQTIEDYLKAIYEFEEDGDAVSTTALSAHFRTSPAAATKMVKQLAEQKLVKHTPYYGTRLTEAGAVVALEVIRHHRLLELYLHKALGYTWDEVDAEAERLEHHISEEFEARIDRLLEYPEMDPHGDPIPRPDGTVAASRGTRLVDSEPGSAVTVLRVRDSDPEVLRYLSGIGIRLGERLVVCDKQPFNGPLTLSVNGQTHALGREVANHIFVEPAREDTDAG